MKPTTPVTPMTLGDLIDSALDRYDRARAELATLSAEPAYHVIGLSPIGDDEYLWSY